MVDENRFCVILGDSTIGKTCMLMTYLNGSFPDDYVPTVWEQVTREAKVGGATFPICLLDTSGRLDYYPEMERACKQASTFILCYSVVQAESFANIKRVWLGEVGKQPQAPILLVGCKVDLRETKDEDHIPPSCQPRPKISRAQGAQLAKEIGATFLECSALTMVGLSDVFQTAFRLAVSPPKTKKQKKKKVKNPKRKVLS
jgi:Ras-related C3 botulinum toxin substrate 1